MADLDDFFAKKDRKKSRGGRRAPEEAAGAPPGPPGARKPEPRPRAPRQEGEEPRPGEEDQWREYEETVKDYTGLKIQVLQGGSGQQGGGNSDGGNSSEDQANSDQGKIKGPWNKGDQPEQQAPPPAEEPKPKPEPPAAPVKVASTAYVPPSVRRQPLPEVNRRQQNRHAPDIHNDDFFPVLGASNTKRGGGWSTAGAQQPVSRGAAPSARQPLSLGNRFNTLEDDS